MPTVKLVPAKLTLGSLRILGANPCVIDIPNTAWEQVQKSHARLQAVLQRAAPAYGINTGFGKMARTRIEAADLSTLQRNLVRSHAAGVGSSLAPQTVRLALILKTMSLAQGYSGVRPQIVERLIEMVSQDMLPVVPEKGSVGASGDLAPLAHMSLPLIGEGEVFWNGSTMPAAKALQAVGLDALTLEAKEGLALLNGTQISTALAIDALFGAEQNLASAVVTGAISVDAALGSYVPFDGRIHDIRRQTGQILIARLYRTLLRTANSTTHTLTVTGCRIPTVFAVSHRYSAPVSTSSATPRASFCVRPMPCPTIPCCAQTPVKFSLAATFMPNRSPWRLTIWRWRLPRPVLCPSGVSPC